ncbi:hypothetical protein D515_04860 [Grimontia indica]|uniref:Uncharacterized protein n=1 Tax=Grimontia indica TaxID=1056512 RepID=R1IJI9_9GAMM|nr:hypothetical protein [Grimontia indica]EOD80881.1 hypothetical protein D515_04860 [Grimontia indica]
MDNSDNSNLMTLKNVDSTLNSNVMPDELVITINKAKSLSNRNGIAWMLFQKNQLIQSHTGFLGDPVFNTPKKPLKSSSTQRLYISSPPHRFSYSKSELNAFIQELNVETVCYPTLSPTLSNLLGVEAFKHDDITLIQPELDATNESLFFGPATIQSQQRPWTTCFVSINAMGQGVAYEHFLSGFGAKSTLYHALTKDTIVAVEKTLYQVDAHLDVIKDKCCAIEIESVEAFRALQSKLASAGQSVLVVLCGYPFFCQLANANVIDESNLYVALTGVPSFAEYPASTNHPEPKIPSLWHWKVISTQGFDSGVLVKMRREIGIES